MQIQSSLDETGPLETLGPTEPTSCGTTDTVVKLTLPFDGVHPASCTHAGWGWGTGHMHQGGGPMAHCVLLLGEMPPHDYCAGNFIPKEESTFQNHILNE